ncbi:hypothetical protein A4X06_0g9745, partial [Tilletia controversa]
MQRDQQAAHLVTQHTNSTILQLAGLVQGAFTSILNEVDSLANREVKVTVHIEQHQQRTGSSPVAVAALAQSVGEPSDCLTCSPFSDYPSHDLLALHLFFTSCPFFYSAATAPGPSHNSRHRLLVFSFGSALAPVSPFSSAAPFPSAAPLSASAFTSSSALVLASSTSASTSAVITPPSPSPPARALTVAPHALTVAPHSSAAVSEDSSAAVRDDRLSITSNEDENIEHQLESEQQQQRSEQPPLLLPSPSSSLPSQSPAFALPLRGGAAAAAAEEETVPIFQQSRALTSIVHVWQEYEKGINHGPAVRDLEARWQHKWRTDTKSRKFFSQRNKIYAKVMRLAHDKRITEVQAAQA